MEVVPVCSAHKAKMTICELIECYKVAKEDYEEEDLRNVQVPETQVEQAIEGTKLESTAYTEPIKTRKVNIETTENPKFVQIGYYWNDETVEKIACLNREYQDLFPTKFSEMKGIAGDLGKMKILLKPGPKPVLQRPYKLNMRYKEKVKDKIDRILDAGIIKLVEESEWIIPMVVHEKNIGEIMIYVDLRKLNDT